MRDALLIVDVFQNFGHEDGDALLRSFRARQPALVRALEDARSSGVPVVYANDSYGAWDGDAPRLVREAVGGKGGAFVAPVAPREGDRFVVKPRYSAFDHTPLEIILRELEVERVLLAGAATEMCVIQTAIDAKEEGFKVTILADACATADEGIEQLAFEYAEKVVGAFVERAGG
jgi:nicotinamidase-related amidase